MRGKAIGGEKMETVIAELATALMCLLGGSCVIAWMQDLLTYVSTLL